ncbi:MAG: hypothetical protein ABIH04_04470 [Planctomycetota bacterium]
MKKKLGLLRNIAAVLCAVILMAVGGVFASGALTVEKAGYMVEVLEGKLPAPPEKPKRLTREEAQTESEKILADVIELRELWERKLEEKPMETSRFTSYLVTLRSTLKQMMDDIDTRTGKLDAEILAFEEERDKFEQALRDEGFEKQLEVIGKLEAEQAAATIRDWEDEDILRLFRQMKSSKLGEIITELNRFPAKEGQGTRGSELLKQLDEFTMASTDGAAAGNGQASRETP